MRQPALAPYLKSERLPGPEVDTDDLGGFTAITLPTTAFFEHLSMPLASFYVNKARRVFLPYILGGDQPVWKGVVAEDGGPGAGASGWARL